MAVCVSALCVFCVQMVAAIDGQRRGCGMLVQSFDFKLSLRDVSATDLYVSCVGFEVQLCT